MWSNLVGERKEILFVREAVQLIYLLKFGHFICRVLFYDKASEGNDMIMELVATSSVSFFIFYCTLNL